MGVSIASYHDQSFDPAPFGKSQLDHLLLSYSVTVSNLAKVYKDLGESYHKLPLPIRGRFLYPKSWQEYSLLAFTCSDSREMPDMIQVINMTTEALARARAALLCDEFALAISRLSVAGLLLEEAEHRVANLVYAMGCYEGLLKSLKNRISVPGFDASFDKTKGGEKLVTVEGQTKLKWLDALPKCLQDVEEDTTDSGYNSSRSSVILE
ncbi:hypothetical protein Slin15195_G058370 [Septoria linicola]|uniref:Uncharacterized protein n=1 Tax=Septoria linicola TaxID=215465 RepID=A0A9Q9EKL7_9PEZI|nr:hypothetical protein Slin14017_G074230 [Septoria linicola]USW52518.1 hypothetical protein Slin15195_G058370 [Septoria linicola]